MNARRTTYKGGLRQVFSQEQENTGSSVEFRCVWCTFPCLLCLFMVLVCAGPPWISLAVVFSRLSRTAYQHACAHMALPARATALPRIQEFDVGFIYHVRLTRARSPMDGLCLACQCSDAVQKVFHCHGVASLARAGPTFQRPARQTITVRLASVLRARS